MCEVSELRTKHVKHFLPMGYKYKIHDQSKAYYLTFTVVQWVDVFSRKTYTDIVIDSLRYCQKNKGLVIYAYVIMSNHLHLLASSENENLSQTIADFKKFTSKVIIKEIQESNESRKDWMLNLFSFETKKHNRNKYFQFWKHESHPIQIYSNKFIKQKVEYIHDNPVKAGIVEKPEDYMYSSARNYADMEGVLDVVRLSLNVL